MNLLRTALIISAATTVNGFAPSASAPSSTRLMGTGAGGQAEEDAAMYYEAPKVGKKVATVNNSLSQFKKDKSAPAWQKAFMSGKKTEAKEAAPKKEAKEEAPKKAAKKFPWSK